MQMSKRDLQRIEVLTEVFSGQRTTESAAAVLDVSLRQTQRLLSRYRSGGGAALIHKARGRAPTNQFNVGVRDYAVELVRQNYRDFGPTLAAEILLERYGIQVSRETLRKWMTEAGLWLSRKQRRTFHQPRLRRESYGELIQIDGSDHRWFESRGEPNTLERRGYFWRIWIPLTDNRLSAEKLERKKQFRQKQAVLPILIREGMDMPVFSDCFCRNS
jgi:transposase